MNPQSPLSAVIVPDHQPTIMNWLWLQELTRLEDDNIDAVIGLPSNLFYSTGIPVCVLVLKKCRKNEKILFINASSDEHYEKGKRQNVLRDKDVDDIVETYQYRREISRYSRQVSLQEIKENDLRVYLGAPAGAR